MSRAGLNHDELKRLFDLSLDLHCVATFDGHFKFINPAFERLLGYPACELLSRPFLDFIHPEDLESTEQALSQLGAGMTVVAFENRYRCADGVYKTLQWNSAPDESAELILASARDVTRERELQKQLDLDKEMRALGVVSAGVAHDLRNILMPIMCMSEILMENTETQIRKPKLLFK